MEDGDSVPKISLLLQAMYTTVPKISLCSLREADDHVRSGPQREMPRGIFREGSPHGEVVLQLHRVMPLLQFLQFKDLLELTKVCWWLLPLEVHNCRRIVNLSKGPFSSPTPTLPHSLALSVCLSPPCSSSHTHACAQVSQSRRVPGPAALTRARRLLRSVLHCFAAVLRRI